jgi:hypothetical protein
MVELSAAGGMNFANFDSAEWQAWQEREEKMKRLRFDRDELSYRAINRLRSVLRPEQIEAIGGLPEPQEEDPWMYFP